MPPWLNLMSADIDDDMAVPNGATLTGNGVGRPPDSGSEPGAAAGSANGAGVALGTAANGVPGLADGAASGVPGITNGVDDLASGVLGFAKDGNGRAPGATA